MAQSEIVFCNSSGSVWRKSGVPVRLVKGEPWWRSDPFVKERPDLFDDEPTKVRGTRKVTAKKG